MVNKSDNNFDKKIEFSTPFFEKISSILEFISPEELKIIEDKKSFNQAIFDLLKSEEKSNKKLAFMLVSEVWAKFFHEYDNFHLDKKFVKLALSKDSSIFFTLSRDLKADKDIGFVTLESMIREWRNFLEIESFIENNFPKNKNKFFTHYNKILNQTNLHYSKDLNLTISNIKINNKDFYDLLISLEIIKSNWKKVEINNKFITDIVSQLNTIDWYILNDTKTKNEIKISILENILWVDFKNLDEDQEYLIETILKFIHIEESKIKLEEKVITDVDEELEENEISIKEELNNDIEEESFEDFWTHCYPECEISRSWSWYSINTISWKNIHISESDAINFTTNAFKNFIWFYNTLYKIWLNFLWDKYSSDFKTLCNNKVWFNYLNGNWLTESKTLQILNIIWKNIWIPEEEVIDEKWEKTGRYKCFNNLQHAIDTYSTIKSTWDISWDKFSDNWAFWNWAVENKLIYEWLIDTKKWILNINKWK